MSKLSKFSAILFAIMLSFVSISRDHYEPLLTTVIPGTDGEHHTYFSEKNFSDVFCSHRQADHAVSPVNQLPAPGSKIHPTDFSEGLFSIELRIRSITSLYLSNSEKIYPGLAVSDIIFPFHYFW